MLQSGIVGLPNVGKSTLFNALTKSRKAEAANYPFCTIDPNVGVVQVPMIDLRAWRKSQGHKPLYLPQSKWLISPVWLQEQAKAKA